MPTYTVTLLVEAESIVAANAALRALRGRNIDGTTFIPLPDLRERKAVVKEVPFSDETVEWKIGDKAVLNHKCNPKYLIGAPCTVVGHKVTNLIVAFDRDYGVRQNGQPRYRKGAQIPCPPALLDKVQEGALV